MKKSLLALAALTAFAGAASAQSSVTLFGIVDAAFTRISGGGKSNKGLTNSNYNSSRLGFRGVEDLGGGLKAGFWLEGQLFNDTGDGSATGADLDFQRRSTVSLMGNFGEIRLGRDYSPNFWNTTVYDAFGTNGVGSSNTFAMLGAVPTSGANNNSAVRTSNSVGYFLPAMGGLFGQVMVGFGEQVSGPGEDLNDYIGARVGYAAGPLSMAVAYAKTDGATSGGDVKYLNFGAQYSFGAFTPQLIVAQEKSGSGAKVRGIQVGLLANVGPGTIRASYGDYDVKNSNNDWKKMAIGYVHNLSKRTVVYASYARVANDGAQTRTVTANGLTNPGVSPGGNSSGMEFGLRHAF